MRTRPRVFGAKLEHRETGSKSPSLAPKEGVEPKEKEGEEILGRTEAGGQRNEGKERKVDHDSR